MRILRTGILLPVAASMILCFWAQAAAQQNASAVHPTAEAKGKTAKEPTGSSRHLGREPGASVSVRPPVGGANAPQKPNRPARRDPFRPMLGPGHAANAEEHLPPGKAGLIIAKLRVLGVVASPRGAIAIVANDRGRVYFLPDGDRVYDGRVAAVSLNGVSFVEDGKDAFGRAVQMAVTKRLGAAAGEQP